MAQMTRFAFFPINKKKQKKMPIKKRTMKKPSLKKKSKKPSHRNKKPSHRNKKSSRKKTRVQQSVIDRAKKTPCVDHYKIRLSGGSAGQPFFLDNKYRTKAQIEQYIHRKLEGPFKFVSGGADVIIIPDEINRASKTALGVNPNARVMKLDEFIAVYSEPNY